MPVVNAAGEIIREIRDRDIDSAQKKRLEYYALLQWPRDRREIMNLGETGVREWLHSMPMKKALLITSLRNFQNRWRILTEARIFWWPFGRRKQIRKLLIEYLELYSPARIKKISETSRRKSA